MNWVFCLFVCLFVPVCGGGCRIGLDRNNGGLGGCMETGVVFGWIRGLEV